MGRHVNRRWLNAVATTFLALMVVTSIVTIPLILFTKAGK